METLRVRDLMTKDVVSVVADSSAKVAWDLMSEGEVRHLVVLDRDGDLLGVVSHRDLLRDALIEQPDLPRDLERELLARTSVREVMTQPVVTAEAEQDLAEAARSLFDNKIGCLPVVEGKRVIGILTESDFVRWFGYGARSGGAASGVDLVGTKLSSGEAWRSLSE